MKGRGEGWSYRRVLITVVVREKPLSTCFRKAVCAYSAKRYCDGSTAIFCHRTAFLEAVGEER
jgi:hypothetical protein